MKKLIVAFLLFVSVSAYGQSYITVSDTLLYGDSVFQISDIKRPDGQFSYITITVVDTGGVSNQVVDTCKVYSLSRNRPPGSTSPIDKWVQVGLRNLLTFDDGEFTLNANATRSYLVLDPAIDDLRIVRTNVADIVGRQTLIIVKLFR